MDPVTPWLAPAKLNLFLHITGRREDGYHDLQTVFQFLDWCDELQIRLRSDGRILRQGGLAEVPAEADLTVRAARLLQAHTGCCLGADIVLHKRIPAGGGLGGGSSDAATVLHALNHLWSLDLPPVELAQLGLKLGADVPVFIGGVAAFGTGVGEILTPVTPDTPWYVILHPGCMVSTADIFNAPELTRCTPATTITRFFSAPQAHGNDCEPVVLARYPQIAAAHRWLGRHAHARLTGTGACVYAAFADESGARDVFAQRPAGFEGFVARGLNRSPLLGQLSARNH
jgi:4-diphosphocytidyl-2-C-methyl-D-erythritol kinase